MLKVNRIHVARSHISGHGVQVCPKLRGILEGSLKVDNHALFPASFPLFVPLFQIFRHCEEIFYNFRPKFIEKFRKKLTNVFQYFLQNCTSED